MQVQKSREHLEQQWCHQHEVVAADHDDLDIRPSPEEPFQVMGCGDPPESTAEDHNAFLRGTYVASVAINKGHENSSAGECPSPVPVRRNVPRRSATDSRRGRDSDTKWCRRPWRESLQRLVERPSRPSHPVGETTPSRRTRRSTDRSLARWRIGPTTFARDNQSCWSSCWTSVGFQSASTIPFGHELPGGSQMISATMAFIRQSTATNSAPWRCSAARQPWPAASMEVTPVRSTQTTGFRWRSTVTRQHSSSCRTKGPANRPSSWNVRTCGVSWTVIRSIADAPDGSPVRVGGHHRYSWPYRPTPKQQSYRRGEHSRPAREGNVWEGLVD